MWSCNRRQFLGFFAATALVGCGFAPAYGPGGAASGLRGKVRAADPADKASFDLVDRLEARLGPPNAPIYALNYVVQTEPEGVAITTANAVTRYNLTGTADWALVEIASNRTLTNGKAQSFTSYSATGSTVAGLAAEEDAEVRLMRILADQIVAQIVATSGTWASP